MTIYHAIKNLPARHSTEEYNTLAQLKGLRDLFETQTISPFANDPIFALEKILMKFGESAQRKFLALPVKQTCDSNNSEWKIRLRQKDRSERGQIIPG